MNFRGKVGVNQPPTTKRPPAPKGGGAKTTRIHIADALSDELKRRRAPMVKGIEDTARLNALRKYRVEMSWEPMGQKFMLYSDHFTLSRPTLRGAIDAIIRAEEKWANSDKEK
jgi:hypothetical protein